MSTIRTFIAVAASDAVRDRAAALVERLWVTPAKVKWVKRENLHWTLKFLGDVEDREIAGVCRGVTEAVANVPPFDATAHGAGAFPSASRPRTVWLGIAAGAEPFVTLHSSVEAKLAELGFRKEHRRFEPHMTLGRVRSGQGGIHELGQLIGIQAEYDAGEMQVSEVVVYSSRLEKSGPVYEVMARIPLGN